MAMEPSEKREILRHLVASIPCAVCQHHYEAGDVRIVDRRNDIWIVAVRCNHCGSKGLILAMVREEKIEIATDLTPEEWTRFQEMSPINADDLLDVHEFLKDFNGDFISLFEGEAENS